MQTIQKKIEVNYRPLQTSGGIEVVGSVPDVQVYQADKAEYTPDYTLTRSEEHTSELQSP